jgi:hypothetical protein
MQTILRVQLVSSVSSHNKETCLFNEMFTRRARPGFREEQGETDYRDKGDSQDRLVHWDLQERTETKAILDHQEKRVLRVPGVKR